MTWFASVGAIILVKPGIFNRGAWRVILGLAIVAVGMFVGLSVLVAAHSWVGILFGSSVMIMYLGVGLVLGDHVRMDDTTLFNYRALPIGSREHPRADITGVGWAGQTLGFVAPVISDTGGNWHVLTALGQQNVGRQIAIAEELADTLGVPFTGHHPNVGYRSSGVI